ncbi:MAG: hypothetical protein GXP25_02550 [Planctomycetes bacterium]|nr:hypothetical protein [Planctomycetota bacterium]
MFERVFGLMVVFLLAVVFATGQSFAQEKTLMEWRFDKDGDFKGWSAGGHIADATAAGGVLKGHAVNVDPILMGPVFEIKATPTQCVEIKMKATADATAELFWTQTLQGKYGGFSGKKVERFDVVGDGQFHVYRIHPFWHAAKKIIRLRVDPPNKGEFEIEHIRIVDTAPGAPSKATAWRFDDGPKGWQAWQDVAEPAARNGCLEVTATGRKPILMSPPLSLSADENAFVSIRMATKTGTMGRVFCVSSTQFGWDSASFPLRPDGKMHSYNVDGGSLRKWRDRILLIGIQPTNDPKGRVQIESIEISPDPKGPAELEIRYFGASDAVNRAGRPVDVTCCLRNLGGDLAKDVKATLSVPDGVKIIGETTKIIDKISLYLAKSATWRIECAKPGKIDISAKIETPGADSLSAEASINLTPAPNVAKSDYIPEPQPVESKKYEIGVYYFPGWASMARWRPILDYPERKPVLGWYDEANPECADWQIKWAAEHGVDFFMVDWYWCQGARHLEHWVHDAYMKSKFRKYLKWCVMWANHNSPNTHSIEDWREVTQYWIDNYFGMEEYYRIDDKPVMIIWAPRNIRRDMGGSEKAAELYALSQKMAKDAGYKGIFFIAMSSHETDAQVKELKAEGYEGFTSYHGFRIARIRAGSKYFPFKDVVETSPELWAERDKRANGLLQMPIVDTGWDSRPWHGAKSMVISDRTPELFGELCRKAAAYADRTGNKIIAIGPWNEWGEGSYIEPYAEYGFQDLDQLRAAFCEPGNYPPNLIPSDVGRGPYDLPVMDAKTEWNFNTNGDREGWSRGTQMRSEVKGGCVVGESVGRDPIMVSPGMLLEADKVRWLVVRMSASEADRPQMFWSTTLSRHCEKNSVRFDVPGDGEMHEFKIDLSKEPQWRGVITSLRFDPVNKPGVTFKIDSILLVRK